jgi:hypothetical protein
VSASTLRAAAALIRERADAATPGPWVHNGEGLVVRSTGERMYVTECYGDQPGIQDAEYIAALSPDFGRAAADLIDTILKVGPVDGGAEWDATVTLARTYLGDPS